MNVLIGSRNDQLGGRLTAMLFAWQLAKFLGADLTWVWPNWSQDTDDVYDIHDLFERSALDALEASGSLRIVSTEEQLVELHGPRASALAALQGRDALQRLEEGLSVDDEVIWYNGTGSAFHKRDKMAKKVVSTQELFGSIPLHPGIRAALDDIDARYDLASTVALHLRRGDVVRRVFFEGSRKAIKHSDSGPIRGFTARYLPLATAKRVLEPEVAKGQRIVLFSDSLDDRRHMEAYYGDKVIDVHATLDQYPLPPVQRAFCELILIGRTHRTYGCASHFSGCASLIGGTKVIKLNHELRADEFIPEINDFLSCTQHTAEERKTILANLLSAYRRYFDSLIGRGGEVQIEAIDRELERVGRAVREARPYEALRNPWDVEPVRRDDTAA